MVAIRVLKPAVQIRMPERQSERGYRHDNAQARVHVVRRREDFPPPTPQLEPCVLWQGSVDHFGYGRHKTNRDGVRRTMNLHRWVMEQSLGRRLAKTEYVMHLCDNPPCYRLSHLVVGTAADNNHDMVNKGRLVHVANASPGESNGSAKLSQRQVDHIRRLWRDGLRAGTIATQYGVSITTIRRIVQGVTWATGPGRDLMAEARADLEARGER